MCHNLDDRRIERDFNQEIWYIALRTLPAVAHQELQAGQYSRVRMSDRRRCRAV